MIRAMSTYVHVRERLHPGILDGLARGGAQAIEIFGARGHFEYTNRQHVREIGSWFKTSGVELHSMHSPMFASTEWGHDVSSPLNIATRDRAGRIAAMDEIKRAIEVAEAVPFRYLIQHIGTSGEGFDEHKFDAAMTSVEHLRAFAKPLGVRILIENIPNELSTPEKLVEFIQVIHFEDVGICYDSGHAHMGDGTLQAIEMMAPYIRSTHIHDNNQDRDSHLWPGEGTIDWNETLRMLRTVPQMPPLLMEIDGEPEGNPEFGKVIPEKMQAAYKKLDTAGI